MGDSLDPNEFCKTFALPASRTKWPGSFREKMMTFGRRWYTLAEILNFRTAGWAGPGQDRSSGICGWVGAAVTALGA
jgi:hypothetical protein